MINSLTNILVKKGIKPTYQRLRILRYLIENPVHPNADTIYEAVSLDIPTISKTTVYNTLHAFAEAGLVNELIITGSEVRFDLKIEGHHHFLCEVCGNIYDLDIDCHYARQGNICGHIIKQLHGYFKGVCADCNEKIAAKEGKK